MAAPLFYVPILPYPHCFLTLNRSEKRNRLFCSFLGFGLFAFDTVFTVELLDTTLGGCEPLTSGEERVAIRAGVDTDFLQYRSGFEFGAASGAVDLDFIVGGVDAFFHGDILLPPWTPCESKVSACLVYHRWYGFARSRIYGIILGNLMDFSRTSKKNPPHRFYLSEGLIGCVYLRSSFRSPALILPILRNTSAKAKVNPAGNTK
jgi:hypothetical protein